MIITDENNVNVALPLRVLTVACGAIFDGVEDEKLQLFVFLSNQRRCRFDSFESMFLCQQTIVARRNIRELLRKRHDTLRGLFLEQNASVPSQIAETQNNCVSTLHDENEWKKTYFNIIDLTPTVSGSAEGSNISNLLKSFAEMA